MLSFIVQTGYPTTVVNLTTDLSSLMVGLVALTAFAAGMIALTAVRYHVAQRAESMRETMPEASTYQQAA
jgi:hypothetical protein